MTIRCGLTRPLSLVLVLLLPCCAGTDPFHIYRAGDGRVLVSHHDLGIHPAAERYALEALGWEQFARVRRYLYVWSQADLDAAMGSAPRPMDEGVCAFAQDPLKVP